MDGERGMEMEKQRLSDQEMVLFLQAVAIPSCNWPPGSKSVSVSVHASWGLRRTSGAGLPRRQPEQRGALQPPMAAGRDLPLHALLMSQIGAGNQLEFGQGVFTGGSVVRRDGE